MRQSLKDVAEDDHAPHASAFKVALIYAAFAALWILLSDRAMGLMFQDADLIVQASMLKGWFFVAITTLLLYFLVRGLVARQQEAYHREIEALHEKQRTHDLLAAIVDHSEDAIFAKDRRGSYLLFNGAASRIVGKPISEVVGYDDRAIFPAEQAEQLMEDDRGVIASGQIETKEETLDTALGRRVFLVTKGPLRDAEKRIFGLFGISRDITEQQQASETLQASEARFRALVEQSLAGIYIIQDRRFRYVNPGFAAIFGYDSPAELIDRIPVVDLVAPGERDLVAENIRRRVAGELVDIHYTFTGLRRDGSHIDVEVHGRRFDFEGKPAVIGMILDITARKAAEDSLRASELRFHDIVRASADWVWEVDVDARFVYASDSVYDLLGYTPAELIGKTPFDLMPVEEAARVANEFATIVARREPFRDLDNVNVCKDGRLIHVLTNGMPILDADGNLLGYRGLDRDVSEKKQADLALQQLADDLKATLQAIPDLLFEVDVEGRYLAVKASQQSLLAAPVEQLIGRTVGEVLPPEAAATIMTALADANRNGADFGRVIVLPLAQGTCYFELSVARKPEVAGQHKRFIVLSRDVTRRKLAEDELRQRNEELERFNKATTGREIDMIAMKIQINAMAQELGRPPPYPLDFLRNPEGGKGT